MARVYQELESAKYLQPTRQEALRKVKSGKKATLTDFNFVFFGVFMIGALLMAAEKIPAFQEWPFLRLLF